MQLSVSANAHLLKWRPSASDQSIYARIIHQELEMRRLAEEKYASPRSIEDLRKAKERLGSAGGKALVETEKLLTEADINKALSQSKHRFFDRKIIENMRSYKRQLRSEKLYERSG